jgi:hypothetical protein
MASEYPMAARENRTALFCLRLAGLILLLTGLAKIVSAIGSARVLGVIDPFFGVPFRWLFISVGAIELAVALYIFVGRSLVLRGLALAILVTDMVLYRAGLILTHWPHPCPCLGNFTDTIHVSPALADHFLITALFYMGITGYGITLLHWRDTPTATSRAPFASSP